MSDERQNNTVMDMGWGGEPVRRKQILPAAHTNHIRLPETADAASGSLFRLTSHPPGAAEAAFAARALGKFFHHFKLRLQHGHDHHLRHACHRFDDERFAAAVPQ